MDVAVKVSKPRKTRMQDVDGIYKPALTVNFIVSSVDFSGDYTSSVTLLTKDATKENAREAIKKIIKEYIEQNVIPWQEYREAITIVEGK